MRIAVCGPYREEVISKVEKAFGITAKKPELVVNGDSQIIDYAAETYKYLDEENVVFDGSAFDFLTQEKGDGYDDVYEQIALNTLGNLDYIAVITSDMDRNLHKMYYEYQKLFQEKFRIYSVPSDFELTLN